MLLFGLVVCVWSSYCKADIPTYQMEENCGTTINMILDSVYQLNLRLDDTVIYDNSLKSATQPSCRTRIEPWYTWPNLMFYFESLDLDCSLGYLQFFQSLVNGTRVQGLEGDVCGDQKPAGVFTLETDSLLTIVYVPKRSQYIEDAISLVITAYASAPCPVHGFKCDNSRCIDRDIRCEGYDSCGDGSGCNFDLSSIAMAGIIISSCVGFFILISVAICVVCCLRKKQKSQGSIQNHSQQVVVYTATQNYPSMSGPSVYNTSQCGQAGAHTAYSSDQSSRLTVSPAVFSVTAGQQPAYPANWTMPQSYQQNYFRNPPPYEEIHYDTLGDVVSAPENVAQSSDTPETQENDETEDKTNDEPNETTGKL